MTERKKECHQGKNCPGSQKSEQSGRQFACMVKI